MEVGTGCTVDQMIVTWFYVDIIQDTQRRRVNSH